MINCSDGVELWALAGTDAATTSASVTATRDAVDPTEPSLRALFGDIRRSHLQAPADDEQIPFVAKWEIQPSALARMAKNRRISFLTIIGYVQHLVKPRVCFNPRKNWSDKA